MRDVSLHILDLIENSINANADYIEIEVFESSADNILKVSVKDNGDGIEEKDLKNVFNPFYTHKKNKSTGLGLALFKETAERTNGYVKIESEKDKGTKVFGAYNTASIDFIGKGDIAESFAVSAVANPQIHFKFIVYKDSEKKVLDTREFKSTEIDIYDYKGILRFFE